MAKHEYTNRYVAVAVSGEIVPPKSETSAPQVEVTCRVVEGADAGKEFRVWLSLKEGQAQEISAKTLRTMGWRCNDITALEGLGSTKFDACQYNDEYKGKTSTKYDIWPCKGPRNTLREDDRQSFAARFKALAAATPAAPVTEANAAPATLPPARSTSDNSTTGSTPAGVSDPSSLFA
jgi:hypothetical protein